MAATMTQVVCISSRRLNIADPKPPLKKTAHRLPGGRTMRVPPSHNALMPL